ncbi:MAG: DEAD/DEAH box helicase [Promethearchaeota archaeon]
MVAPEPSKIVLSFKGNDLVMKSDQESSYLGIIGGFNHIRLEGGKGVKVRPKDAWKIKELLEKNGFEVEIAFNTGNYLENHIMYDFTPREYQSKALSAWARENRNGVIVLPTGSGKSFLGIMAIQETNLKTLIVVPTIELMKQWKDVLEEHVRHDIDPEDKGQNTVTIGIFGGGEREIAPITVATYYSAYLYLPKLRDRFGLLIFDEVHHLPGEKFKFIATGSVAPNRLGLTATLDESEVIYPIIQDAVGNVVYRLAPSDLSGSKNLSPYVHEKIEVDLPENEMKQYESTKEIYTSYMKKLPRSRNKFQQMIFNVNRDPEAFKAMGAFNKARAIAFNAGQKLVEIGNIFRKHRDERILTFCEDISFVERISRTFLVPAITSNTPTAERRAILDNFRSGTYRILASGKVLDEGVDVPEASVGIIVSGTGTPRQFIQRLGRILRPMPGKTAFLYEIVSSGTSELNVSSRRTKKGRVPLKIERNGVGS